MKHRRWVWIVPVFFLLALPFHGAMYQPAAAQMAATTFAVISDYGVCLAAEQSVATMVNSWSPQVIVTAGDNWQYDDMGGGGTCDSYEEAVGRYYGSYVAKASLLPSPGNHDYMADNPNGLDRYRTYFSYIPADADPAGYNAERRYYDFVRGDVHFFMLDAAGMINGSQHTVSNQELYDAQRAWLQNGLQNSTAAWQIVVFHYPPYSSCNQGQEELMRWPFAQWGAEGVFSGHNHVYERVMHDGIPYFTVGMGGMYGNLWGTIVPGSAVRYNSDPGAMRATATDTTLTFEFLAIDGTMADNYVVTHAPPMPTGTPPMPTGTPETPTGTPETPTGTPETPTGTPETPTGTPETPTPGGLRRILVPAVNANAAAARCGVLS